MNTKEHNDGRPTIPEDHPRSQSLHYRHKLVDGMYAKVVTPSGLIAHGRGEAYDYVMGEETHPNSERAIEAAVAAIMLAEHPIISVNGNIAALVPEQTVELAKATGAQLEVNIFYREEGRIEAIEKTLRKAGAESILGLGDVEPETLSDLSSNRRIVDPRGIFKADVVLVPLEDGDRTENLVEKGKTVIAIDLNPLSRTAQMAQITIVDNLIRCFPKMIDVAKDLRKKVEKQGKHALRDIVESFDQEKNLDDAVQLIIDYLERKKISKN